MPLGFVTTTPLVTLSRVKAFLSIRETDATHNDNLSLLMDAATLEIENQTNRTLSRAERTEVFSTRRTSYTTYDEFGGSESGLITKSSPQSFYLSGLNIDTLFGLDVRYDPRQKFDDATKLVQDSDYVMDWESSYLTILSGTFAHTRALRVGYLSGYFTTGIEEAEEIDAPADIQLAALYQIAFMFKRTRSDNVGMTGDAGMMTDKSKVGGGRWNTQSGLCKEAQGLLAKYKLPAMGRG